MGPIGGGWKVAMPSQFIALLAFSLLTLLAEGLLWMLFRSKTLSLVAADDIQPGIMHFYDAAQMRKAVIAHTVFLLVCNALAILFLW